MKAIVCILIQDKIVKKKKVTVAFFVKQLIFKMVHNLKILDY